MSMTAAKEGAMSPEPRDDDTIGDQVELTTEQLEDVTGGGLNPAYIPPAIDS